VPWSGNQAPIEASCDGGPMTVLAEASANVTDIGTPLSLYLSQYFASGFTLHGCYLFTSLLGTRCVLLADKPLATAPATTCTLDFSVSDLDYTVSRTCGSTSTAVASGREIFPLENLAIPMGAGLKTVMANGDRVLGCGIGSNLDDNQCVLAPAN
jgi:hypothetical protein